MVRVDLQRKRLIIHENFKNLFAELAQERIKMDNMDYIVSNIQHPIFNNVMETKLPESKVPAAIQEISQFFQRKKCPFSWILTPFNQPSNLKEILLENGFKSLFSFRGMIYELKDFDEKEKLTQTQIPDFKISLVKNIEELDEWIIPLQVAFHFSDAVTEALLQAIKAIFKRSKDKMQHYLAHYQGKLVACASLYLDKKSAGFYNLGVLPEYRHQGFGAAMKNLRLLHAKEKGYQYAILQSSQDGFELDKKIGFKDCMSFEMYSKL